MPLSGTNKTRLIRPVYSTFSVELGGKVGGDIMGGKYLGMHLGRKKNHRGHAHKDSPPRGGGHIIHHQDREELERKVKGSVKKTGKT